jgi:putative transposase
MCCCRILGLSRQSYYYQSKPKKDESELEEVVAEEFIRSRKAYGSRKIKKSLIKTRHSDQPTKN